MAYKILLPGYVPKEALDILRQRPGVAVDEKKGITYDEILAIIGDYEGIFCVSNTKVDARLLDAAKKLKFVGRLGVGTDKIDLAACTKKGILVYNDPNGNTVSAAEQAMALMLCVMRKTVLATNSMRAGEFDRSKTMGFELCAKTIGIIGLGKIGSRVAQYANGFEMKVIGYDPYLKKERAQEMNVELVGSIAEICKRSDIITLHMPMTADKKPIIGANEFSLMKKGIVIINAARGGLVDEAALFENLNNGKVYGAGIDVWSKEPIEKGSMPEKLIALQNVVSAPHLGSRTVDAQLKTGMSIVKQTLLAMDGKVVPFALNLPYMLKPDELENAQTYMNAAKILGAMLYQLGQKKPAKICVEFGGTVPESAKKAVATFAVQGFLEKMRPDANTVNCMLLATEEGIAVSQPAQLQPTDYANAVIITAAYSDGTSDSITASIFSHKFLRIVGYSGYDFEAKASPRMLWTINDDVPGVIGHIGTVLEKYGINIAEMALGRRRKFKKAVAVLAIDANVPEEAIKELKSDSRIGIVRQISLDENLIITPNNKNHANGSEE
ncbi:MAG: phosphoglycerate dehydrogenase [Candidatus Micrarchaeia archaeon]|jgi:D-3-phosphoglycerate dehydrogenase